MNDQASERRLTIVTRRKVLERVGDLAAVGDVDVEGFSLRLKFLRGYRAAPNTEYSSLYDQVVSALTDDSVWIMWQLKHKLLDEATGLMKAPDEAVLAVIVDALHPEVQSDKRRVNFNAAKFNEDLREDGFEIYQIDQISGHPVFSWGRLGGFHSKAGADLTDRYALLGNSHALLDHFKVIERSLRNDPAQAIASSKELVETVLKIILDRSELPYKRAEDIPDLYRKVAELLKLQAESVPESATASASSQGILRTLVTTVRRLAELRNEIGRGHGRAKLSPAYERHARLALNAAVTVTEFLIETWNERVTSGKLVLP